MVTAAPNLSATASDPVNFLLSAERKMH